MNILEKMMEFILLGLGSLALVCGLLLTFGLISGNIGAPTETRKFFDECRFLNGHPRQSDGKLECWYFTDNDVPKKIMEKQWTPSK